MFCMGTGWSQRPPDHPLGRLESLVVDFGLVDDTVASSSQVQPDICTIDILARRGVGNGQTHRLYASELDGCAEVPNSPPPVSSASNKQHVLTIGVGRKKRRCIDRQATTLFNIDGRHMGQW